MSKNIGIIGAGPAGLSCALELIRTYENINITLYDANSIVGGISRTEKTNDYKMDIGGHRFFTKSKEVNSFWKYILDENDIKFMRRGRLSRILYGGKLYNYPISLSKKTLDNLGYTKVCKIGLSYIASNLIKKDETNLENFFINRFGKELYLTFFKDYTEKVWGIKCDEIDSSWGAQRIKGLSIRAVLKDAVMKLLDMSQKEVETSLIDEFDYPKFGPGYFWEKAENLLKEKGVVLHKNCKVHKLNKVTNGFEIESDIGISKFDIVVNSSDLNSLVTKLMNKNTFSELNENILNIASGLEYRDFITVGLLYKKSLNVPDNWIYVQEPKLKIGRLQFFNNWSPFLLANKNNESNESWISAELFSNEGDELDSLSDKELVELCHREISEMKTLDLNTNLEYSLSKVIRQPKAYPSYTGTYKEFDKLKNFLVDIEKFYCIGRNGTHRYNNMDHATLSGIKVAHLILKDIFDESYTKQEKSSTWDVNTEKEYHEEDK